MPSILLQPLSVAQLPHLMSRCHVRVPMPSDLHTSLSPMGRPEESDLCQTASSPPWH